MASGNLGLGKIVLFGSGETSATGRIVHDALMAELSRPITVAILETPAGFQPNSAHVAGEVAEFISHRLQNHHPEIHVIPARKKGEALGPDNPEILAPLRGANYIFLGPGSPTYTVCHLANSLALRYMLGRHQDGATLSFASAATLAAGAKVLPVYEIFKAGARLYWVDGLNVFGLFGLDLAIVPHWNNTEGGADLDTSRCFMGEERFAELQKLLPTSTTILGIDEHTALVFDFVQHEAKVLGKGNVTITNAGSERTYLQGRTFPLGDLGHYNLPDTFPIPPMPRRLAIPPGDTAPIPTEVTDLLGNREDARRERDWARADSLRARIEEMGFEVKDTPEGPLLMSKGKA